MEIIAVPFFIFFILGAGFIALVFGLIVVQWSRRAAEWADNNRQPVVTFEATVSGKRANVSGMSGSSTSTTYYCTFQFVDGRRREFAVSGEDYGMLSEGDRGELMCQGTRYHGFRRR